MLSCGLSLWRSAVAGGGTPPDPILAAFANGEQGAYYDFSDLGSMYADMAGQTAVTGGGTVAQVLDLKRGPPALGPELVVNGDFSDGSSGWTLFEGWSVAGGLATANTTLSSQFLRRAYSGANNRMYRVAATVHMLATPNSAARVGVLMSGSGEAISIVSPSGLVAGQTIEMLGYCRTTSAGSWAVNVGSNANYPMNYTITGISIREVLGNHIAQATNARRPLIEYSGGIGAIVGDGIDKHMRTGPIDLSHTDKVAVMVATRNISGTDKLLARMGTSATSAGSWHLSSEDGYTANIGGGGYRRRRTDGSQLSSVGIIEAVFDRADVTSPTIWINGAPLTGTLTTDSTITGNFSASNLLSLLAGWSGSAAVDASNAALNKVLLIDRAMPAPERSAIRQKWVTDMVLP
jgi:hypothetical protein